MGTVVAAVEALAADTVAVAGMAAVALAAGMAGVVEASGQDKAHTVVAVALAVVDTAAAVEALAAGMAAEEPSVAREAASAAGLRPGSVVQPDGSHL